MASDVRVSNLAALAHNLVLPIGLTLDEVEIYIDEPGATFAEGALKLDSPGRVRVSISPESLQAFIATQLPPIVQNPRIVFQDGLLRATASVRVLVEVSATAILKPVIVTCTELHLELIDFEGPTVARGILEKQIEGQNPVFKASELPIPFSLTGVEVTESLILHGEWNAPD